MRNPTHVNQYSRQSLLAMSLETPISPNADLRLHEKQESANHLALSCWNE
jgi:hypothetical protein